MTIAAGKAILASDIRSIITLVWPEDAGSSSIPSKGDPFDYLTNLDAYSEALVALHFSHAPTSKTFNTDDINIGSQSFSLFNHNAVESLVEGTRIFVFGPQIGTKLLVPTSWGIATTGIGSAGINVLGPLLQSSASSVIGFKSVLGSIICTYHYIATDYPTSGHNTTFTAYDAYFALR